MNAEAPAFPRLLLIADGFATGRRGRDVGGVWAAAEAAAHHGGFRLVMLRDHEASEHEFSTAAEVWLRYLRSDSPPPRVLWEHALEQRPAPAWLQRVRRANRLPLRVVINGRPAVADREGVGLHVGVRGPSVASVAGQYPLLGYSAHTPEEATRAVRDGAHYVTFSPIFPTPSKPSHSGVGLEKLAEAVEAVHPVPVYALGGVTPERVGACLSAGAYGVAVLSGILDAEDPFAAARAYIDAVDRHV